MNWENIRLAEGLGANKRALHHGIIGISSVCRYPHRWYGLARFGYRLLELAAPRAAPAPQEREDEHPAWALAALANQLTITDEMIVAPLTASACYRGRKFSGRCRKRPGKIRREVCQCQPGRGEYGLPGC